MSKLEIKIEVAIDGEVLVERVAPSFDIAKGYLEDLKDTSEKQEAYQDQQAEEHNNLPF